MRALGGGGSYDYGLLVCLSGTEVAIAVSSPLVLLLLLLLQLLLEGEAVVVGMRVEALPLLLVSVGWVVCLAGGGASDEEVPGAAEEALWSIDSFSFLSFAETSASLLICRMTAVAL